MRFVSLFVVFVSIACACSAKNDAPVVDAGTAAEKYAFYMVNFPFGGQRPEWWERAITDAKGDPKKHALLLERAQKNGLAVTEDAQGVRVRPTPELAEKLLAKLNVK
jgi:hypothetical protein